MSAPCGKSCTLAYSRQSLEQLASLIAAPLQCCNGFDKVFYPECNTPSATDDGLYPYQRVARDLLRGADELNLLVASPRARERAASSKSAWRSHAREGSASSWPSPS